MGVGCPESEGKEVAVLVYPPLTRAMTLALSLPISNHHQRPHLHELFKSGFALQPDHDDPVRQVLPEGDVVTGSRGQGTLPDTRDPQDCHQSST